MESGHFRGYFPIDDPVPDLANITVVCYFPFAAPSRSLIPFSTASGIALTYLSVVTAMFLCRSGGLAFAVRENPSFDGDCHASHAT